MCIFCTFLREDISEKHAFFWAYRILGGGHPPQIDFDTFQKVITLPKKCVMGGSPLPELILILFWGQKQKRKGCPDCTLEGGALWANRPSNEKCKIKNKALKNSGR